MKNLITKSSVLGLAMLSLSISANAQWTRNAGTLQTYLTNTGDNVGIGTTNPTFKLDVRSTGIATMNFKSTSDNASLLLDRGTSTSTASLTYRTAGVNNWQTGCVSNNNFTIRNNSLGALTFYCDYVSNNVGIGTNTPAAILSVKNTSLSGISTNGSFQIGESNTANLAMDNNEVQARSNGVGTTLFLNYWGGNISMAQAGGKVGIGTVSPVGKFAVVGTDGGNTVATFGYGSPGISIVQNWPGIYFNSYYNSGDFSMAAGYGGKLEVNPLNGVMQIELSSNSATGSGQALTTLTPLFLTNTGDLTITGNMSAQDGDIYLGPLNGTINAGGGLLDPLVNMMTDLDNHAVVNGDEDLYIGDALEVGTQAYKPGGGSFATISDARLKKDVKNYNDGLEQLMKINPVTFKYNDKVKFLNPDKEYVGIIAQDMQKVAPYMVEEKALFSKSHEDKDGKVVVDDPGQNYLTYDGSALTYMLVNSVKELNTENQNLKQQLAEMRECVQSLCNNQSSKLGVGSAIEKSTLEQNQPNPFNQQTVISYQLKSGDANAKIIIRDLSGNLVKQVAIAQSGKGQVTINANELAQGTYTYTLEVNGESIDTKLMVLVK